MLIGFRGRCYPAGVVSHSITREDSARSARAGVVLRALLAFVAVFVSPALAATVEGQVFDRAGRPLAGVTVLLVLRTPGPLGLQPAAPREDVLARARSDRQGFFTIEHPLAATRDTVLVRCSGGDGWDRVRYALPADLDVTPSLRERGSAVVAIVVDESAEWAGIARAIDQAGGTATERGRILRTHGLPPETLATADGRTVWRYPSATYFFDAKGTLVETKTGPPPRAAADGRGDS